MNSSKSEKIVLMLEIVLIFIVAFCLWYKVLLPAAYFVAIMFLTTLLVVQMLRNQRSKFLIFQIALLFLLIRNVYYLSTNYSIIPFGDGNWDYGVVKTFTQKGSIFVIQEPNSSAKVITWYSGWPLLHTLTLCFSEISGIDAFYTCLLLPSVISVCSFIFVYLFVEKLRKPLKLDTKVTILALLIYATSPDVVFWPMQFVRQNLGILLLTITFYLIYLSIINPHNAKYKALTMFFAMSIVMTHHFTSFTMVSYFFLFSFFLVIGKYFAETRVGSKLFWSSPNLSIIGIAFATFAFLFVWWNNFGAMIWPSIGSSIRRFIEILNGIRQIEYLPARAFYPNLLTPIWATSLLTLRDILMYIPAFFGLFLITVKVSKISQKFFVIYSILAFGTLFVIDNLIFRIEIYRIITLSLPFTVLLSATLYTHIENKLKHILHIPIRAIIVTLLLSSSFIGLWGHSFAPIHLYDPSINTVEVGERNTDFMRVHGFFTEKIPINSFQAVWVDDYAPLVRLLEPTNYSKIMKLSFEYTQRDPSSNELVCVFKDLYLYAYYARRYSPIKTPQESNRVRYELYEYLNKRYNKIYDDGKYQFWVSVRVRET